MKNFIKYNPTTGEITGSGVCQDGDLALQGSNTIEGTGSSRSHYVADGEIVAYTEEQAAAKASRPNYPVNWSNVSMSWEPLSGFDTLGIVKTRKWEQLKAERTTREEAGFTWDGHVFDSSPKSQLAFNNLFAYAAFQTTYEVDWTLADNSVVTLDLDDIKAVAEALRAHIQGIQDISQSLRDDIDAADTIEDVQAVTWPT